jgi:hypothetical protein
MFADAYDTRAIRSGRVGVLPNDRNGRSVLLFEASRYATGSYEDQLRSFFYNLAIVMDIQSGSTEGIVLLVLLDEDKIEMATMQASLSDVRSVFPLNFAAIHVIVRTCGRNVFAHPNIVAPLLAHLIGPPGEQLHFHFGNEASHFTDSLTTYGLLKESLPVFFGGYWSDAKLPELQKEQTQDECKNSSFPNERKDPPNLGEESRKRTRTTSECHLDSVAHGQISNQRFGQGLPAQPDTLRNALFDNQNKHVITNRPVGNRTSSWPHSQSFVNQNESLGTSIENQTTPHTSTTGIDASMVPREDASQLFQRLPLFPQASEKDLGAIHALWVQLMK